MGSAEGAKAAAAPARAHITVARSIVRGKMDAKGDRIDFIAKGNDSFTSFFSGWF